MLLDQFASAILSGSIKIIDLTQTLTPTTPVIQLPPPFAPSNPFSISEISHYDERGPGWYWNNLGMGEHTGTHFDAPVHWVSGKDYSDGACDTINVQRFVAPAVVIDVSKEAAADEKFLMEPSHIEVWESLHREPKELSPKYFYDQRGSELFEEITRLPEYYLTRAERGLLHAVAPTLVATTLVELGAGNAEKTRILLDAMSGLTT